MLLLNAIFFITKTITQSVPLNCIKEWVDSDLHSFTRLAYLAPHVSVIEACHDGVVVHRRS